VGGAQEALAWRENACYDAALDSGRWWPTRWTRPVWHGGARRSNGRWPELGRDGTARRGTGSDGIVGEEHRWGGTGEEAERRGPETRQRLGGTRLVRAGRRPCDGGVEAVTKKKVAREMQLDGEKNGVAVCWRCPDGGWGRDDGETALSTSNTAWGEIRWRLYCERHVLQVVGEDWCVGPRAVVGGRQVDPTQRSFQI
jgi:hypothetical protein